MNLARIVLTFALVGASVASGCLGLDQGPEVEPRATNPPEALLLATTYSEVLVDVDHVPGRAPSDHALGVLERELHNVTGKPIHVQAPTPIQVEDDSRDKEWTVDEIDALRARVILGQDPWRWGADDMALLHVLYLNGQLFANGLQAAGVALSQTAVVMKDTTDSLLGGGGPVAVPQPTPEIIERAVLVHETGHVLGLVGLSVPMQHERLAEDDPCECHSSSDESVMQRGVGAAHGLQEMLQDNEWVPYKFDRYDREDLRAFQQARGG